MQKILKTLYIYGCSGIGKAIIDTVNRGPLTYNQFIFVDDDEQKSETNFYGCPVISPHEFFLQATSNDHMILAFFKPADIFTRSSRAEEIKAQVHAQFVSIIDDSAVVSPSAKIGEGVYLAPNVILDSDSIVGDHSILLFNSVVSREVQLSNACFLSAGVVIKGSVRISKSVFLSANSVITKDISANAFVNAGVRVTGKIVSNSILSERTENVCIELGENLTAAIRKLRFLHP